MPRDLCITSNNGALNAALVVTTKDAESTLLAPGIIPRVDAGPIGGAVVNAPANHLDSVATKGLAGDVLVDTRGVSLEVLIDGEGNRECSLGHELLLHGILTLDGVA